jgi:DNA-binding NtrC family response regulator
VLITGETGTGKEMCARAIHHLGPRRDRPFIPVDCASIPENLFENELFGHARGAYTHADGNQKGLVALAEGGTLLLDEIDTMPVTVQAKLLRFLQEHSYKPLGAERFARSDVRIIAATNRSIEERLRDGRFRADLYFRLNVLRLELPPLRERRSDIAPLAKHFLSLLAAASGTSKSFTPAALHKLWGYEWPGNIRELFNIVQRALVLSTGNQILPCHICLPNVESLEENPAGGFRQARLRNIQTFERHYVEDLLRRNQGNITRAARAANKDRRAFGRLVKKYDIKCERIDPVDG